MAKSKKTAPAPAAAEQATEGQTEQATEGQTEQATEGQTVPNPDPENIPETTQVAGETKLIDNTDVQEAAETQAKAETRDLDGKTKLVTYT
ncbi:hypothetical protein QQS45_08415 [Alteriqipengyuania flavescens]|uniref:hypothetical protein n=1 Tax=Alteriqipengyuania flavescens TaxID=3053610 RepID=UPI0025B3421B|nr:hypothetical protein [Alteriqipengyuania flavescens]WJY17670.1 hypothetical protein QQW98_08410 [Alteriqipengyuania flavescens]WJY23613.1 hypothetical protein QQS45_08415 [Alteriqipengyuania flavescens]